MRLDAKLCILLDESEFKMISVKTSGDTNRIEKFLQAMKYRSYLKHLDKFGVMGVEALSNDTPRRTGETANSWSYEIQEESGGITIHWTNSKTNEGLHIVLLLQYGHGTNHGGYVRGIDYINPALKPIFDEIANQAWLEVTRS